jgi:hypothetical protein
MKFDVRPCCASAHYWDIFIYAGANQKQFDKDGIRVPKPAMDVAMAKYKYFKYTCSRKLFCEQVPYFYFELFSSSTANLSWVLEYRVAI